VDSREERFRRLYDVGRERVLGYAMRRTTNYEDTADVAAETFAIAWRRIDDIPSGEREIPWLFAVARRVIANRLRTNSTQSAIAHRLARQLALSAPRESEPDPERLSALHALSQLSEEDREILMLVAWDGLSSQELGWVFACSPTAARIRLHRARARLDDEWADGRMIASKVSQQLQEGPEL
jgi:RNA polymerase sigma-70 factor (ECF subfamily)